MRMEKKKTRARLEKRRRKWVTKNMLSTSSWIPIMILKIFFGWSGKMQLRLEQLSWFWWRTRVLQWPRQPGLLVQQLVSFTMCYFCQKLK